MKKNLDSASKVSAVSEFWAMWGTCVCTKPNQNCTARDCRNIRKVKNIDLYRKKLKHFTPMYHEYHSHPSRAMLLSQFCIGLLIGVFAYIIISNWPVESKPTINQYGGVGTVQYGPAIPK